MKQSKKVDKPRALQHKGNLGLSRIIMLSKRKEQRNDTDNNKDSKGIAPEVKRAGEEERINS